MFSQNMRLGSFSAPSIATVRASASRGRGEPHPLSAVLNWPFATLRASCENPPRRFGNGGPTRKAQLR